MRIEQEGNFVRMHIKPPFGEKETIERELEKYALVISNQAPPEMLFENRAQVMRLEHKLEITKLEVKQAQDLLQLTRDLTSHRVNNLEQEVASLREQIGNQLLHTGQIINLASQQAISYERVQLAQISQASDLFKDLIGESHGNHAVQLAIDSLRHDLMAGIALIDVQDHISNSLTTIKKEKPTLLEHIAAQVESASFGAVGSYVLDWISKQSL